MCSTRCSSLAKQCKGEQIYTCEDGWAKTGLGRMVAGKGRQGGEGGLPKEILKCPKIAIGLSGRMITYALIACVLLSCASQLTAHRLGGTSLGGSTRRKQGADERRAGMDRGIRVDFRSNAETDQEITRPLAWLSWASTRGGGRCYPLCSRPL